MKRVFRQRRIVTHVVTRHRNRPVTVRLDDTGEEPDLDVAEMIERVGLSDLEYADNGRVEWNEELA